MISKGDKRPRKFQGGADRWTHTNHWTNINCTANTGGKDIRTVYQGGSPGLGKNGTIWKILGVANPYSNAQ